jgi:hypothetical protein
MEKEFNEWLNKNYYLTEGKNIQSSTDLMAFLLEYHNCEYKDCFLSLFSLLYDFIRKDEK